MSNNSTPRNETEKIGDLKSLLKLKKRYDPPDAGSLPASYKTNSEKELLWLWCANNLIRLLNNDCLMNFGC